MWGNTNQLLFQPTSTSSLEGRIYNLQGQSADRSGVDWGMDSCPSCSAAAYLLPAAVLRISCTRQEDSSNCCHLETRRSGMGLRYMSALLLPICMTVSYWLLDRTPRSHKCQSSRGQYPRGNTTTGRMAGSHAFHWKPYRFQESPSWLPSTITSHR